MGAVVAGVIALCVLLLLARGYLRTSARTLASGMRFSGGLILALVTLALAITGRIGFAFVTATGAWYLLFGSAPPWGNPYGAYRDGAGGPQGNRQSGNSAPPRANSMSRSEALKVLGLDEGATEEQIRAAHKRLILQTHPDKGGTNYLAAKINEAKDALLGRR
jgi:DnaJ-domain-containing protein 1